MTKLQTEVAEMNRIKKEVERCVSLLNQTREIQDKLTPVTTVRDQLNKLLSEMPGDSRGQINICSECHRYFLSYNKMKICIDCSSNKNEEVEQ